MKPRVSLLVVTSVDGGLHPSRFTASPDGTRRDWSAQYEAVQKALQADAWVVGRVTMAEMSKAGPHPPAAPQSVVRPLHVADAAAKSFAIALDRSGRLHFQNGTLQGDHVVVLLGKDVPDEHLAELANDGVSYLVSGGHEFDIPAILATLGREFGIEHLVVEGGAAANGTFLAAQVVDEMRVLVAPGLDGASQVQGIVAYREGLAGRVELRLLSAAVLEHGVVELRYAVSAPR